MAVLNVCDRCHRPSKDDAPLHLYRVYKCKLDSAEKVTAPESYVSKNEHTLCNACFDLWCSHLKRRTRERASS